MININMDGADDLFRDLRRIQEEAKKLEGEHSIQLSELLNDDFIARNTEFSTLDQMIASCDGVEAQDDLESPEWSRFVATNSRFESASEMEEAAVTEWTEKKLKDIGF